jgi:hypothetical protein
MGAWPKRVRGPKAMPLRETVKHTSPCKCCANCCREIEPRSMKQAKSSVNGWKDLLYDAQSIASSKGLDRKPNCAHDCAQSSG